MNPFYRKVLYIFLWYLVYPQLWYLLIIPELFLDHKNLLFLSAILISYITGIMDTYFRPFSESMRKDVSTNPIYNMFMLALFVLHPLLMIFAFQENRLLVADYLPFWDNMLVSFLGISILTIGGLVTVTGRAQLSKYGSGVLRIEEDHILITTGILGHIRHPVYAGGLLGVVGIYLAFRSIIMLIMVSILYFVVIRHRLLFEEQLLIREFGEEYENYMERTKRLIPFLY